MSVLSRENGRKARSLLGTGAAGVEPGSEKKAQEPNAEEGMGLKAGPG